MSVVVVPELTVVSLCDATTGWTGSPTPVLHDTTIWDQIQGDRCLQSYSAGAAVRNATYDFGAGNLQAFGGKILIIWFSFSRKAYSATNPPMKIRLTDSAGHYRDWHIFDKTTLPHTGWIPWIIHADYGYDFQSNVNFNINQIRYVGWRIEESVVGKTYIWWDAVRFGTGLTIKGGTSSSPATLEHLYQADIAPANAYGLIDKLAGVYYSSGKISIGSLTPNESTYFKDVNQVLQFKSLKGNPTGFYEIKGQRAATGTGTTEIYFGEKTGDAGISGLFIRAPIEMKWKLTMSDPNITKFGFYACTFVNANTIEGQSYDINKEFLSCSFVTCAEMLPHTGIVRKCFFISSPGRAIRISSTSHNVIDCQFINCYVAVHHDVGGPSDSPVEYDYDRLFFSGGTYHIENSAYTPNYYILIDRLNGSNPDGTKILNSNGGNTTLKEIGVVLRLTKLAQGSEVIVLRAGTQEVIDSIESVTSYDPDDGYYWDFSYYYETNYYVDIFIHKEDYEWYPIWNLLLGPSNSKLPISQRKERVYYNP